MKTVEQMDMSELWNWLYEHPVYVFPQGDIPDFWHALATGLDIDYAKVSPKSLRRCKDEKLNTQVRCWLEFGPLWMPDEEQRALMGDSAPDSPQASHDIRLDCGGDTFEEAFRNLCLLVLKYDGDYDRK